MYVRMRADGEVVYGRAYRQWFVFGCAEVQQMLRSDECATSPNSSGPRPNDGNGSKRRPESWAAWSNPSPRSMQQ